MGFPEHLATTRRKRGLTQATLAERASVHVNQISRYEQGLSEPSLAVLRNLAVALSVTTDALVFDKDARQSEDARLRLAFEATRYLSSEEKKAVRMLLEAFLATHRDEGGGRTSPRARKTRRGPTGQ